MSDGCWEGTVERIREGRARVWEVGWCGPGCDSRGGVERTCMTRQSSSRVTSTISTAQPSAFPEELVGTVKSRTRRRSRPRTAVYSERWMRILAESPQRDISLLREIHSPRALEVKVSAPVGVDDVPCLA